MKFTKMHGAGNDFVILDNLSGSIPESDYSRLAQTLCRRRGKDAEGHCRQ